MPARSTISPSSKGNMTARSWEEASEYSAPAGVLQFIGQAHLDGVRGSRIYKRSKISPEATVILTRFFEKQPLPDLETRQSLAASLGMTPRSVQVWFQNRRQRSKPTTAAQAQAKTAHAALFEPRGASGASTPERSPEAGCDALLLLCSCASQEL